MVHILAGENLKFTKQGIYKYVRNTLPVKVICSINTVVLLPRDFLFYMQQELLFVHLLNHICNAPTKAKKGGFFSG